jgi:hypothetical protein
LGGGGVHAHAHVVVGCARHVAAARARGGWCKHASGPARAQVPSTHAFKA